ncbi:MAG TPA: hypothetical protein VIY47_05530, partial [Ignavibacteriaceae bacterium]
MCEELQAPSISLFSVRYWSSILEESVEYTVLAWDEESIYNQVENECPAEYRLGGYCRDSETL